MKMPLSFFLSAIEEKKVFYFSSDELNTEVPHFFVCIRKTESDLLFLSCCTSQFDTVRRFIETRKLPQETLVWIDFTKANDLFAKDTYVNCNQYFNYTVQDFVEMYENDRIEVRGEIPFVYYEQIVLGLLESPLIDEETKDIFREIEL